LQATVSPSCHPEFVAITRSIGTPENLLAAGLIRDARKLAGLTQLQVAGELGRPQSFVADIESGQRRVDLVEFLNLADVIGFDPLSLLSDLVRERAGRS
jgi:transcriptional regulator with XRE-family HTH domain